MKYQECNISYFQNLREKSGALILIDVREEDEFTEVSAPCASNFPLSQLDVGETLKALGLASDEGETTLFFICRSGRRSAAAAEAFYDQGFKNVYNVKGGMEEWCRLGYPTRS